MPSMRAPCRCLVWSTWWPSTRLSTCTAWYAVDASVWPRCDAETSPQRGYYHHHTRQSHGQPIVAGWNYSWLVQVPERCSSWTAPLRVRRMQPGANVNQVAAEQIRSFLHQRRASQPRPIFTFDAGYDPVQLGVALAGLDVSAQVAVALGPLFLRRPAARTDRRASAAAWDARLFVTIPPPGPRQPTNGAPPMRTMVGCSGSRGADCMRSHKTTRSEARARRVPLSAEPSSAWRWNASPKPTKVPVPLWCMVYRPRHPSISLRCPHCLIGVTVTYFPG
jgi:hypothetical protein